MNRNLFYATISFLIIIIVFSLFSGVPVYNKEKQADGIPKVYNIPEDDLKGQQYTDETDASQNKDDLKANETDDEKNTDVKSVYDICIIMDDLGYGYEKKFDVFRRLKGYKVTMSIIPGLHNSKKAEEAGVLSGFEVMVHIPMQAIGLKNNSENIISVGLTHDEIYSKLDTMLKDFKYIKGANNHQGSKVTSDKRTMGIVLSYLKNRNLFFVDSLTVSKNKSVVADLCKKLNMDTISRDIFIDNEADPEKIRIQLDKCKKIARKYGSAIGICHIRKETVDVLEKYLPELLKEGSYRLVFASSFNKKKKTSSVVSNNF